MFRPLPFLEAFTCDGCVYLKGEYCSFFSDFVNSGVAFQQIPYTCQLSDFTFDGETIRFSSIRPKKDSNA